MRRIPVIEPGHTFASVTDKISAIVLTQRTRGSGTWDLTLFILVLALFCDRIPVDHGRRGLGINVPVGWDLRLSTLSGGSASDTRALISAIFALLLRQKWRQSINRFAEAMTLFAVACAIYFAAASGTPLVCLLAVSTRAPWESSRSSVARWCGRLCGLHLFHDFVAVLALADSPILQPCAIRRASRFARFAYGILAMGWRGSAIHWHRYEMAYLLLAGLATPLVVSVHTVVSFDFAVALVPVALDDFSALLVAERLLRLRHGANSPSRCVNCTASKTSSPCVI